MDTQNFNPADNEQSKETVTEERGNEIHHHHYYYSREARHRAMNFGQLFFGLLLLFFGIAYLVNVLGLSEFNFTITWGLVLPILAVAAGLSLISFRGWIGGLIGLILVLVLASIVLFMSFAPVNFRHMGSYQTIEGFDYQVEKISIAKEASAQQADITIKTGAGEFSISGDSGDLISGDFASSFLRWQQANEMDGKTQVVDLATIGEWPMMMGKVNNKLDLKLNSDLPLALNLETGAAAMNFDFSKIKLSDLTVKTGASSLVLKLGDKVAVSKVKIKAGASSIKIILPVTVGARVSVDSGLSSKNFPEFDQLNNDSYQSENYNDTIKKIDFDLGIGLSSVDIAWEPSLTK